MDAFRLHARRGVAEQELHASAHEKSLWSMYRARGE